MIDAFRKTVTNCGSPFTSGDAITVADFTRELTGSHGLEAHTGAEEFFKLAVDCGLDPDDARGKGFGQTVR